MVVHLYPHQQKAVSDLHNGSILWGEVGTGKSRVAAAYYMKNEAPKDVYVITTAKKRDSLDWDGEFASYGVGKEIDGTVAGRLCVDSWNNIHRYRNVVGGFFIFDEQRLVGNGKWVKGFTSIAKQNNWILLTATPGDTWLDYIPVFIANGYYKNRSDFKREHVVYNPFTKFPKVQRYLGVGKLVRLRNKILVEMPFDKQTIVHNIRINVDYDKQLMDKVVKQKWHVYEDKPIQNLAQLFYVMRRVVNSDGSRLEVLQSLMEKHPRLIVFYNFDYELEILRTLGENTFTEQGPLSMPSMSSKNIMKKNSEEGSKITKDFLQREKENGIQIAEWNGHKHEPVPKTERWIYLVQYAAGAEGWNCTSTDTTVFYSLPYSYKLWHQAHGRTNRLGCIGKKLFYYTCFAKSEIEFGIWSCLASKRNFNEAAFKVKEQIGT